VDLRKTARAGSLQLAQWRWGFGPSNVESWGTLVALGRDWSDADPAQKTGIEKKQNLAKKYEENALTSTLFFGSCIPPLSASFTPLKALDPTLVSQLKESLPAALFEKLNGSLSIDLDQLKFAEYKIRVLEERLRLVRIDKYGPGSEKLSDAQLELLELEPGVSSAEVKAESERDQLKLPLKPRRKHPGRQELPANLARIEKIIACTLEQCVCGNARKGMLHRFNFVNLSRSSFRPRPKGLSLKMSAGSQNRPLFGTENSSSDGRAPALFFVQAAFPRPAEKQKYLTG
jgi:hypothetical protein